MRLVQVFIPNGKKESVLAVLSAETIDYAVWNETGRQKFEALVQFLVPAIGVEPILDKLDKAGISKDAYTVVITPTMVISERVKSLDNRYPGERISREELIARAEELAPALSTYLLLLVLRACLKI